MKPEGRSASAGMTRSVNLGVLLGIAFNKLREEGPAGAFRKALKYFKLGGGDRSFDARLGVDTCGVVPLWRVAIDSPNARFGVQYQPTGEAEFRAAIGALGIDPALYSYVDLGCGKGRTLLLASRLGFAEILGVEFGRELADTARANLRKLGIENASVVDGDAARFAFPPGDLVVFLYNPFGPQVLDPVLENLRRRGAGNLFLVYSEPKHAELVDACGFLRPLGPVPGYPNIALYEWIGNQRASAQRVGSPQFLF